MTTNFESVVTFAENNPVVDCLFVDRENKVLIVEAAGQTAGARSMFMIHKVTDGKFEAYNYFEYGSKKEPITSDKYSYVEDAFHFVIRHALNVAREYVKRRIANEIADAVGVSSYNGRFEVSNANEVGMRLRSNDEEYDNVVFVEIDDNGMLSGGIYRQWRRGVSKGDNDVLFESIAQHELNIRARSFATKYCF